MDVNYIYIYVHKFTTRVLHPIALAWARTGNLRQQLAYHT